MQELRLAIQKFSARKKADFGNKSKVVAYADTFTSQGKYYLASACDEIRVEPLATFPLVGLGMRPAVRSSHIS